MSVRFQDGAALEADYATHPPMPASIPLSVTCWLYFAEDDRPEVGDTWTLWWFGEVGAAGDNYVALLAERGTTQGVKLTASGKLGANTLAATIDDVPIGEGFPAGSGWHCVSVVLSALSLARKLTLYVDDLTPDDDTGAMAVGVTTWDRFAAGRSYSAIPQGLEQFSIEQVAIWEGALGSGDNARMYEERIPPKDAVAAGLDIDKSPDFSYWFLAPHARGGIPVADDEVFDNRNNGGIFNEARPSANPSINGKPLLGWNQAMQGTPRWSARTPVFRYTVDQPIEPIARPAFVEPSRLQPHFFIVNGPQLGPSSSARCPTNGYANAEVRAMSYFRDPNMSYTSKVDYLSANALQPPYTQADGTTVQYLPQKDLSLVAKRMADWFAVQSFTAGRGVGPGNRYAGGLQMRGPGDGGVVNGALRGLLGMAPSTGGVSFPGTPDGIPLELHYDDRVVANGGVQESWQAWYRASGHAYLKPWMDHFWAALKQELDARDLCYPLRIHLDYEGWVRSTSQLRVDSNTNQVGAWPFVAVDGRKNTEVLFKDIDPSTGLQRTRTLAQVLADDPAPSYDADRNFYDDENEAFAQWWWKYEYACRTWAVYEALLATVKDYFPGTLVGDYSKYPCDHPGYPDVEQVEPRAFNSAPNASFPLDFGTPVLYSGEGWVDNVRGAYGGRVGYTITESVRDVATMNIDAVANARVKTRVAPTFEDATRELGWGARLDPRACSVLGQWQNLYELTPEDQRHVMEHAWRRGATDFLLFSFRFWYGEGNAGMFETKLDACRWLRDSVHSCAQHDQARTGRTARVGWRSM